MSSTTLWKFTLRSVRAGLISREAARSVALSVLVNSGRARVRL